MIELRINNIPLDLLPDTSISLEINNPLLGRDVIPGSYSLPFTLPATGRNKQLLGFPDRLDLAGKPNTRYACVLYINGIYWRNGELILRKLERERYQANFQTDVSILKDKLGKSIKSLPHQAVNLDVQNSLTASAGLNNVVYQEENPPYNEADINAVIAAANAKPYVNFLLYYTESLFDYFDFVITINGREYTTNFIDQIEVVNDVMNQINNDPQQTVKARWYAKSVDSVNTAAWFFYESSGNLSAPLQINFPEKYNPEIDARWQDQYLTLFDADFNTRFKDNSLPSADFVMPTFYNELLLGEKNPRGLHNFFSASEARYKFSYPEGTYGLVPMYSLGYVLRKIEEDTGLRITGNLKASFFERLIFFNNHCINIIQDDSVAMARQINPANHLPDMSISELLIALGNMFNLGFFYNEDANTLESFHLRDILSGSPTDISQEASPQYSLDVADPANGAIFSLTNPRSDKMYEREDQAEMAPLTQGGGKDAITTRLGTVYTRQKIVVRFSLFLTNFFLLIRKMPEAHEEGTLGNEAGNPAPRLLYYDHRQTDSQGLYPYATSDGLRPDGSVITGGSALVWDGPQGLFQNWWKEWYAFEQNRKQLEFRTFWKMPRLLNHQHRNHYKYQGKTFLVRSLKLSISMRRGLLPQELNVDTIE